MPPELLFDVSIVDSRGEIVAGTRASALTHVGDQYHFQSQRATNVFSVGRPRQSPDTGAWKLQFSRRLEGPGGAFAGIVMLSVDASFFVSGYESAKLGEHGMLGMLGTDGVFRAWRSGDSVSAGQSVDYATVVPAAGDAQSEARLVGNAWDGVARYTSARQLYDFPLAVIVGLSAQEQLAHVGRDTPAHWWRALGGSAIALLVIAVLARMSWRLTLAHRLSVAEQAAHAQRVEFLAYHDGLTGLPNRRHFDRLLGLAIERARLRERQLAVLFVDLDRFKNINDTLGHDAGDQLLNEVATRIRACLRADDTVARLGGDEFVALLPDLEDERYAAGVAAKIIAAVSQPLLLRGQEFVVTASIGISLYPRDGLDEGTLKKSADTAMYKAKEEGKNGFQFFTRKLDAHSRERLSIEAGLRHAIERDELQLHYLAKRGMRDGRITGVEALLRWQHPVLGNVAPLLFLPVAEDTGMSVPIGKWVLRTACAQSAAWRDAGLPAVSMAVNLSRRQFYDATLLADLAAILAQTGMDAHGLELEITESLLMRDVEKAVEILKALKEGMGLRIAIDNFGSGYSSLFALRRFPLDAIKFDRSFVRDVAGVADACLSEALIAMGKTLSLTVVAQGVETKAQADFLRRTGIDEFQGFFLDQPVPAEAMARSLRMQRDEEAAKGLAPTGT